VSREAIIPQNGHGLFGLDVLDLSLVPLSNKRLYSLTSKLQNLFIT
jgi:hypothetical protein